MKKILVTGAAGFVGTHLLAELAKRGDALVTGMDSKAPRDAKIPFATGDICDGSFVESVVSGCKPDEIYHLAAVLRHDNPRTLYDVNIIGTLNLMEALSKAGLKPKTMIASSSAVYGAGSEGCPITERSALRPVTHYGVTKVALETVALRYQEACGIPVFCCRTFNLLGPGLPPILACASFARKIALIEKSGSPGEIKTGDLSHKRDFIDVRDAVRAYSMLMNAGATGIYNVCSGVPVSIRSCLDILLGMAAVEVRHIADSSLFQQNDVALQTGSFALLEKATGWKPEISVRDSIGDLLDFWRKNV